MTDCRNRTKRRVFLACFWKIWKSSLPLLEQDQLRPDFLRLEMKRNKIFNLKNKYSLARRCIDKNLLMTALFFSLVRKSKWILKKSVCSSSYFRLIFLLKTLKWTITSAHFYILIWFIKHLVFISCILIIVLRYISCLCLVLLKRNSKDRTK